MGSLVRTRLVKRFENLDFVRNLLFPLLRNSKSVVDDKTGKCNSISEVNPFLSRSPLMTV